jgi:hypothetical protein
MALTIPAIAEIAARRQFRRGVISQLRYWSSS